MARQVIDLTTPQPNGKMGEPTKAAWEKVNSMTSEIYSYIQDQGHITGAILEYVSGGSYRVTAGSFYVPSLGAVISSSSPVTKNPSLPVNQYLHVYGYLNGTSVDYETSTTAPSSPYFGTARTKSGDTSRRYIGSMKIDSNGSIYNFIIVGNEYYYQTNIISAPFPVLSNGSATSITSINCSNVIPSVSRVGIFTVTNTDSSARLDIYNGSGVGPIVFVNGTNSDQLRIPVSASQSIQYAYASTPTGNANIRANGYLFER